MLSLFLSLSLSLALIHCAPSHIVPNHETGPSVNESIGQAFFALNAPPSTGRSIQASTISVSSASGIRGPLVMAYYPDWASSALAPESINFLLFDIIDFAFAVPTEDGSLTFDDRLLRRLVAAAHTCDTKVKLSIGGWTGSKFFSQLVSNEERRLRFAQNILTVYKDHNLDGIDIDWEYPGRNGFEGNFIHPNDSRNYLLFLQLLRALLPVQAYISAAVQTLPFADEYGRPMNDASAFASVLDWILMMNYDVWGSSTIPGPNAPMQDVCKNSTQSDANAVAAFNQWTDVGFPASKLVLGVPSYGYISKSRATRLMGRSNSHFLTTELNEDEDDDNDDDDSGLMIEIIDEDEGQIQFCQMMDQGALVFDNGSFTGSGLYTRFWDECSLTPYLRSETYEQVISYDDPESLRMKSAFAKEVGMLGVNMFDIHGDTGQWHLTKAIRRGLGVDAE